MDVAAWAAASDPARNRQFARRWTDPPPQTRKRQRRHPLASFGHPEVNQQTHSTDPAASAQRAVRVAAARVGRLQHEARILRSIGQRDAGVRLAALAETILAEVLA